MLHKISFKSFIGFLLLAVLFVGATSVIAGGKYSIHPTSGNWNYTSTFEVHAYEALPWLLACQSPRDGEVFTDECHERDGLLLAGQSEPIGLGAKCFRWQLDFDLDGDGDYNDIGYVVEPQNCNEPEPTEEPTPVHTPTPEVTPEVTEEPTVVLTDTFPGVECPIRGLNGENAALMPYEIDGHAVRIWTYLDIIQGKVGPFGHGTWFDQHETIELDLGEGYTFHANWTVDRGMPVYDCWITNAEPTQTPETETVCIDCPPADCGLQEGRFVRIAIGETEYYWGLVENQITAFDSYNAAENSGLEFWGTECGLCAEGWAVRDGLAFYGPGMTRWDLAVAIAQAADRNRDNLLDRDLEAASAVSQAWHRDGRPENGGWYSYR